MKLLFSLFTIELLLSSIVTSENTTENTIEVSEQKMGKCECGVFEEDQSNNKEDVAPILKQNPLNVTCDDVGSNNCQNICTALAQAAKQMGLQILCKAAGHADLLKPMLHIRICDLNWVYTGLSNPTPICCHDGALIECNVDSSTLFPTTV